MKSFKKIFWFLFQVAVIVLGVIWIWSNFVHADTPFQIPVKFPPSKLLFDRDLTKSGYSFVPTGIVTSNRAQIWYAGSDSKHPGDHIFYRNAKTIDEPFEINGVNNYEVALAPTHFSGKLNTFDAWHTCDPSVIKARDGKFYLYYGGAAVGPDGTNKYEQKYITELGVASSTDGRTWTRANYGQAILRSSSDRPGVSPNEYGTGQPSAVYLQGYVYLFYTDTVSPASNATNGAGIYVIRSRDPSFKMGSIVEAWTDTGWFSLPSAGNKETLDNYLKRVSKPLAQVVSVEVQYNDTLNKFLMGIHGIAKTLELAVINPDNFNVEWVGKILYDTTNADGPGFFRGADGHSVLGSGNSVTGLVPIRAIHSATNTDVFGTKLHLSNTVLTWGDTGPIPQPTVTPTPTPQPQARIWGYDDLGLASHCSTYLNAPSLPGLGTVLEVFGDPLPCVENAIKKGVTDVRIHLIDATCWRNNVCLPGAANPTDVSEIKKRAATLQVLATRYPNVHFTGSPALEHDVHDEGVVRNMLNAVPQGCPSCSVINSPASGATPAGYDVERHGTTTTAVSVSSDGASIFDGDNLANDGNKFQHRLAGSRNTYAWWNALNKRCTGEKTYVPVAKRSEQPELWQYQMAHKILTTEEDAYPKAPGQCRRVRRIASPETNKPTAEKYCNGSPGTNDSRGNKNLLIIKDIKSGDKSILRSDGKKIGCFRYYGTYAGGLFRWYEGNCSGLNPWQLFNASGNEWNFLDEGGGNCLMFNAIRREGTYR